MARKSLSSFTATQGEESKVSAPPTECMKGQPLRLNLGSWRGWTRPAIAQGEAAHAPVI